MSDAEFFNTVGSKLKFRRPSTQDDPEVGLEEQGNEPVSSINPDPRWAYSDDIFWSASATRKTIDPGFYKFEHGQMGNCLHKTVVSTDTLIRLPDTTTETILAEFSTFWELKDRFIQRGFLHKRGILLWGSPGSGKTASLMLMAEDIIQNHNGIVCEIDHPVLAANCLSMIRKIEPERRIVAFLEDIDALVERHGENAFLSLLDGETQINNIAYIATTNYPERLDKRFVDRPSRFDTVRWIGMPSAQARRLYLKTKEPSLDADELQEWVSKSDGFSVAHLRELVILVKCFDQPLDVAIQRLETMRMRPPNSGDAPDRPLFGIGRDKTKS